MRGIADPSCYSRLAKNVYVTMHHQVLAQPLQANFDYSEILFAIRAKLLLVRTTRHLSQQVLPMYPQSVKPFKVLQFYVAVDNPLYMRRHQRQPEKRVSNTTSAINSAEIKLQKSHFRNLAFPEYHSKSLS